MRRHGAPNGVASYAPTVQGANHPRRTRKDRTADLQLPFGTPGLLQQIGCRRICDLQIVEHLIGRDKHILHHLLEVRC